jgi:hypothetical protein
VLEETTRIADHIAKLELDWLEMEIYPLTAGRLQRAEQSIAPQVMNGLRFGHFSYRDPVAWTYPSGGSGAGRGEREVPRY